jgi:regulatory protein
LDEPLDLALKALGRKERTVAELGSWLRGRGVSDEQVEVVVGHLVEDGALDDARFAHRYAEDKRELAGWGSDRIRSALLQRGVSAEDLEGAVGAEEPEGELGRATALLLQRGISVRSERDRSRAFQFLVRRGYDFELAYDAIRQAGADDD